MSADDYLVPPPASTDRISRRLRTHLNDLSAARRLYNSRVIELRCIYAIDRNALSSALRSADYVILRAANATALVAFIASAAAAALTVDANPLIHSALIGAAVFAGAFYAAGLFLVSATRQRYVLALADCAYLETAGQHEERNLTLEELLAPENFVERAAA